MRGVGKRMRAVRSVHSPPSLSACYCSVLTQVCQRENSFYIETVRNFRDRRYDYKKLTKVWAGKLRAAHKSGDEKAAKTAGDKTLLFDSLQLAHKCILNSFYGSVNRQASHSHEMLSSRSPTRLSLTACVCAVNTP